MAATTKCKGDTLAATAECDKYAFYLPGCRLPNCVDYEFAVDKRRLASVVPCQPKGKIQFGQPKGLPTVTQDTWSRFAGEDLLALATAVSDDQPDCNKAQKVSLVFGREGWKVSCNKVCIQADALLTCGTPIDREDWTDNLNFAFFQTLQSSKTKFVFQDPDIPHSLYTTQRVLREGYSFPLLDVNAYLGQTYRSRKERPWAPYYSTVSYINLSPSMVKDMEERPQKISLSGCISMGDIPAVGVPHWVEVTTWPTSSNPHSGSADFAPVKKRCFLSTAHYCQQYYSWLAVHDKSKNIVWPLAMFEWYFKFDAHVEGSKLVFDTDTPPTPCHPKVYTNGDSQTPPIPDFPIDVLKTVDNYYVAADDDCIYKWVYS